jgi:tetratricopeptide (TPR) repeat protein
MGLACYANKGYHDKAIADYTKAIKLQPKSGVTYNNRGKAYSEKGDYDKADIDFKKAKKLGDDE